MKHSTPFRPQRNGAPLRVALVHDWLTGMRGGEKVLESLCRLFPDAPLWTLIHNRGSVSELIERRTIHPSLLQRMPMAARKYRSYLPLFPLFAELNKARNADIVISTSHAVAKSMVRRGGRRQPLHVAYIHTPMRYVWDLFDEYFGPERVGKFASRWFFRPIANMLRRYDRRTIDRVDVLLANSHYVADRIHRTWGRTAAVLPPPVDVERYRTLERDPEPWYLVVSALVPYKRVDQAIRACARLGRKLVIVGKGPEDLRLRRLATELNANVNFTGFVPDEDLGGFYRRAQALLFPGVEDFGIVPVEAIACGCPVIAFAEGGVLDSMTPKTAVFYHSPTENALCDAIAEFESRPHTFPADTLRAHAEQFSEERFLQRFTEHLTQALADSSLTSHETQISHGVGISAATESNKREETAVSAVSV